MSHICNKISRYDIKILCGDFNAKIGKESAIIQQVAGKHSLHENCNDNGMRLCSFAELQGLFISSTSFQHKRVHKQTWKFPGHNGANQIDHILIDKRHMSSIIDVRSYRGANCDSDHYMVVARVRQRIISRIRKNEFKKKHWNVEEVITNESTRKKYQEKVERKLGDIKENLIEADITSKWQSLKEAILSAANETIGQKAVITNEWYDAECRELNKAKNEARKACLENSTRRNLQKYKERRKEAKKIIKKKKKDYMKRELEIIEQDFHNKQTRSMYRRIKKHTSQFQPRLMACKNRNGDLVSDRNEVLNIWKEHFNELLNNNEDDAPNSTVCTVENRLEDPDLNDTERAIEKLKNYKSGGEDCINAELIKYGGEELIRQIHEIILQIWRAENMPEEWYTSLIVPIYKKGDKLNCVNYRGIALLNVSYKILSNILYEKLNVYAEEIVGDYQCGFRIGRSTTDQCFIMSQIFEKCYEFNINLHCLFIDFKQAFDKLNRKYIDHHLKVLGIPQKYINLINMTLIHSNAKVIMNGEISDEFKMKSGVRQGDSLSALLFNLTLHSAINEIDQGGTIFYKSTQICAYADDIVILARNREALQNVFMRLVQATRPAGLNINEEKTKYMTRSFHDSHIRIGRYTFEFMQEFKYLGVVLSINKDPSLSIQDRIQAANRAYFGHIKLMKSSLISKEQKLQMYKTIIRPVLTYGCETWVLKVNDVNLLMRFERKILRRIFGPIRLEDGTYRIRYNHELSVLIAGGNVTRFIKSQRLRWYGHVLRMSSERATKKVFEANTEGARRRGRPRRRWLQDVVDDIRKMRISQHRAKAGCREEWRRIVEEAMVHPGL